MSDEQSAGNAAAVAPNGPLCLTGAIRIEEGAGIVAETDDVALCRCGHSRDKPFCDGSHNEAGFADPGVIMGGRLAPGPRAAGPGGGASAEDAPGRGAVQILCAEDGPLLVRGPLAVIGADGVSSTGEKGALCRCGASANKPFCDGAHREAGFVAPSRGSERK